MRATSLAPSGPLRAVANPEPETGPGVGPVGRRRGGVPAHSACVGLASELTRRSASTTDVMLAGNWKASRMVAHYSSAATARGAVAQYL